MAAPPVSPALPPPQPVTDKRHLLAGVHIGYGNSTKIYVIDTLDPTPLTKTVQNAFTGIQLLSKNDLSERAIVFVEDLVKELRKIKKLREIPFSRITIATPGKDAVISRTIKNAFVENLKQEDSKERLFTLDRAIVFKDEELTCLPEPYIYHQLFYRPQPESDGKIRVILYADKTVFSMGKCSNVLTNCSGSKGPLADAGSLCSFAINATKGLLIYSDHLNSPYRSDERPDIGTSLAIFETAARNSMRQLYDHMVNRQMQSPASQLAEKIRDNRKNFESGFEMNSIPEFEILATVLTAEDWFTCQALKSFAEEIDKHFTDGIKQQNQTKRTDTGVICTFIGEMIDVANKNGMLMPANQDLNMWQTTNITFEKSTEKNFNDPAYAAAALSATSVNDNLREKYTPPTEKNFKSIEMNKSAYWSRFLDQLYNPH